MSSDSDTQPLFVGFHFVHYLFLFAVSHISSYYVAPSSTSLSVSISISSKLRPANIITFADCLRGGSLEEEEIKLSLIHLDIHFGLSVFTCILEGGRVEGRDGGIESAGGGWGLWC